MAGKLNRTFPGVRVHAPSTGRSDSLTREPFTPWRFARAATSFVRQSCSVSELATKGRSDLLASQGSPQFPAMIRLAWAASGVILDAVSRLVRYTATGAAGGRLSARRS